MVSRKNARKVQQRVEDQHHVDMQMYEAARSRSPVRTASVIESLESGYGHTPVDTSNKVRAPRDDSQMGRAIADMI